MKRRRRPPSSGSIYKRKDGAWIASLRHDGRRFERRAPSKAEAREKLDELRAHVVRPVDPSKMMVSDLLARYLKHIEQNKAASTTAGYKAVLAHAAPVRKYALSEIRAIHIVDLVDGVSSAQTRHKMFKLLKAAFNKGIEWGFITAQESPMNGLEAPKYSSKEPNPFEPEERAALMEVAAESRYFGALRLAMMLGPRPAEVWGFQWRDWNGNDQLRLVRQAAEVGGQVEIKPPKTKAGTRTLLLPDILIADLHDRQKEALREGFADKTDFIWPGRKGHVTRRNNFSYRVWNDWLKAAGIEHRGFHQCRHTAATTMLNHGVAIKLVSKILGHSKVSMTLDIYNSLLTADQNQAVDFWNRQTG